MGLLIHQSSLIIFLAFDEGERCLYNFLKKVMKKFCYQAQTILIGLSKLTSDNFNLIRKVLIINQRPWLFFCFCSQIKEDFSMITLVFGKGERTPLEFC